MDHAVNQQAARRLSPATEWGREFRGLYPIRNGSLPLSRAPETTAVERLILERGVEQIDNRAGPLTLAQRPDAPPGAVAKPPRTVPAGDRENAVDRERDRAETLARALGQQRRQSGRRSRATLLRSRRNAIGCGPQLREAAKAGHGGGRAKAGGRAGARTAAGQGGGPRARPCFGSGGARHGSKRRFKSRERPPRQRPSKCRPPNGRSGSSETERRRSRATLLQFRRNATGCGPQLQQP